MLLLDDFQELQRRVQRVKSLRDEGRGRLAQLYKTLKEQYEVETTEEGYTLRDEKAALADKLRAKYLKEKPAFDEEYADQLKKV